MGNIGDNGTEQFEVETRVNGEVIKSQPIHDPFILSTTIVGLSRWDHFKALFRPITIKVDIQVRGSEGAQRAIMTLDPTELQVVTKEILVCRAQSRLTTSGQCCTFTQE